MSFKYFLLLFISAASFGKQVAISDTLGSALDHGKFSVGYKTLYVTDKSRNFYSDLGRPIRIMIWYPSSVRNSKNAEINFDSYFQQQPKDSAYNKYFQLLSVRDISTLNRQYFATDSLLFIDNLKKMKTFSRANVNVSKGKFPIVMYALGRNDYQQENTILYEYLASHGYIVITVPQVGPSSENSRIGFTLTNLLLQKDDLEFVLRNVQNYIENADSKKVFAMGHSFGGLVSILLSTNPKNNVKAIISLDGTNTTKDGINLLKEGNIDPGVINVPILNLFKTKPPIIDFSFTDGMIKSDRLNVGISNATHFDFQNWPVFLKVAGIEDSRAGKLRTSDEAVLNYYSSCKIIKNFISEISERGISEEILNLSLFSEWKGIETKYQVRSAQ